MRRARWLIALAAFAAPAVPLAADPGEADRLLKQGFPDRDYSAAPVKLVIAGQNCVLAASALKFEADGTARLTDAAVVRVRTVRGHEVVDTAAGTSARVTFDRPVKTADELGRSKVVSVETPDGRVIRLR